MALAELSVQNMLLRRNLERVARLSRHGLMLLLDLERSKTSTEALRRRARIRVMCGESLQTDYDLARVERMDSEIAP